MTEYTINALVEAGIEPAISAEFFILISCLFQLVEAGSYQEAHERLTSELGLTAVDKISIRKAITHRLLLDREREWSAHGVWKSFRFWSLEEKIDYLNRANRLIDLLETIVPNVTYGFGSVLGFVRDGDFMPHDDDMDLLVAIPKGDADNYSDAKSALIKILSESGLNVYNENRTHFTANGVDVFIGFAESDSSIAWFPSCRKSGLVLNDIFPPSEISVLGVSVKIPNNSEKYLEVTYGPDWRIPNLGWEHPWNISEYLDYCK